MAGKCRRLGLKVIPALQSTSHTKRCAFANKSILILFEYEPIGSRYSASITPVNSETDFARFGTSGRIENADVYFIDSLVAVRAPEVIVERMSRHLSLKDKVQQSVDDLFRYGSDLLEGDTEILSSLKEFHRVWTEFQRGPLHLWPFWKFVEEHPELTVRLG